MSPDPVLNIIGWMAVIGSLALIAAIIYINHDDTRAN